jgi:hypothetical protein
VASRTPALASLSMARCVPFDRVFPTEIQYRRASAEWELPRPTPSTLTRETPGPSGGTVAARFSATVLAKHVRQGTVTVVIPSAAAYSSGATPCRPTVATHELALPLSQTAGVLP